MIQFEELTIILPLYIESDDRYNNVKSVLSYFNTHIKTDLIIHEYIHDKSKLDFLSTLENLHITHFTEKFKLHHRTYQINQMLSVIKTQFVMVLDADVIIPIESFIESYRLLLEDICDFVYPYGSGRYCIQIPKSFDKTDFELDYNINKINKTNKTYSNVGFCYFAKTRVYRQCGGENENFISYTPEDVERYERFKKLGKRVERLNTDVYHFDHLRTELSSEANPYHTNGVNLLNYLRTLDKEQLSLYYKNESYIKKYKNFK